MLRQRRHRSSSVSSSEPFAFQNADPFSCEIRVRVGGRSRDGAALFFADPDSLTWLPSLSSPKMPVTGQTSKYKQQMLPNYTDMTEIFCSDCHCKNGTPKFVTVLMSNWDSVLKRRHGNSMCFNLITFLVSFSEYQLWMFLYGDTER